MLELWKKKFTAKCFYVKHENPVIFVSSQWQRNPGPNLFYLVYRWMVGIFFVISMILSIIDLPRLGSSPGDHAKWLIYLTSWGFTTCTVQTVLGAAMLSSCFLTARNRDTESTTAEDNKALKLYKIYWITNIIATDIAFGITTIYWILIYDATRMPMDGMNVIVHIMNSIIMLIDMCIVAHPVEIMHFYWPVLYGMAYVIFSIIYYAAGGTSKEGTTYIYPILDWSKPGMTIAICAIVTIFIIVLHLFTFGIYSLRKFVHTKVIRNDNEPQKETSIKEAHNNPAMATEAV